MKSLKTTVSGIAAVVVYAIGIFLPEYQDVANGLFALAVAYGFFSAQDQKKEK